MPNLNEYITFIAIVEAKSFTGAAIKLHRSVSSVSKQLSKLEASLGASLIDRSTQSFSITHLGEGFYFKCKDIIEAVGQAEQYVKNGMHSISGKITLSFPEVLLRTPFVDLLKGFNQAYPDITFDLIVSNELDNIIESRIDFAFRMGDLSDSRLTGIPLNRARPMFCATPEYILQKGRPATFKALFVNHRLILPSYLNLSEQLRKFLSSTDKLPISLEYAHTSNNESALYHAVMKSMGVGIMLDVSIASDLKAGSLVELLSETQLPETQMYLVYHQGQQLTEKNKIFKAFIKDNFNTYF